MPGEEQEDVIMTSTQCNLLNFTCPLSGKPLTELADPVRRYCRLTSNISWCFFSQLDLLYVIFLFLETRKLFFFFSYHNWKYYMQKFA